MADDTGDYEIGYRKPPKHTRWPPGVSGNPRGKEKGHKGLKTDLEAELSAVGTVTGSDGWKRKGRQQRLAIATLVRRASQGDLKAQAILFPMILNILGVEDRRKGARQLPEQDQALLEDILKWLGEDDESAPEPEGGGDLGRLPPPPGAPPTDDDGRGEDGADD